MRDKVLGYDGLLYFYNKIKSTINLTKKESKSYTDEQFMARLNGLSFSVVDGVLRITYDEGVM